MALPLFWPIFGQFGPQRKPIVGPKMGTKSRILFVKNIPNTFLRRLDHSFDCISRESAVPKWVIVQLVVIR